MKEQTLEWYLSYKNYINKLLDENLKCYACISIVRIIDNMLIYLKDSHKSHKVLFFIKE